MQTSLHYSRAPIKEALIDFRVVLPADFSVQKLLMIHEQISNQFPTYEPIYFSSLTVQTEPDIPNMQVSTDRQQIGFRFKDRSGLNIFQATLHGFTFNRLQPYETWEKFRSDARKMWGIYKDACEPEVVTRVALRYINQINIPVDVTLDLKDYFRVVPEISPGLTQNRINTFFMQLQIRQEDLDCMLIINETLASPEAPNFFTIILDIDLFRQHVWQSGDKDIWDFLEKLRHRKNEVFKASITEKTEELII
jgi:uncharacterized protein (TIGR04255 family)